MITGVTEGEPKSLAGFSNDTPLPEHLRASIHPKEVTVRPRSEYDRAVDSIRPKKARPSKGYRKYLRQQKAETRFDFKLKDMRIR